MFLGKQRTITHAVSCEGKTTDKNRNKAVITFKPAKADTGVVFKRTDIKGKDNEIKAIYSNIQDDKQTGITLANKNGVKVFNVEHILSSIWGSMIDNIIVEVNCEHLPDLDGSTEPLLFLLKSAGFKELEAPRKVLEIKNEIEISHEKEKISIRPSNSFIIRMDMNLKNGGKLKESFAFDYSVSPYKDTISRARSFSLEQGLKGIDKTDYRHSEEFARHEILDCIGAMYLIGYFMKAEINCVNGNHDLYSQLLKKIAKSKGNYVLV